MPHETCRSAVRYLNVSCLSSLVHGCTLHALG
jgi:hypothetical protein